MFDVTEAEQGLLRDMATIGHSVTDRGAELLRRVLAAIVGAREPEEYPKMVYPEGSVHDESAEPHLLGSPKGVVVNSADEEREALHDPIVEPMPEPAPQGDV